MIHWICQWYRDGNDLRCQELRDALVRVIAHPDIDVVHIIGEEGNCGELGIESPKIAWSEGPRLTFSKAFKYARRHVPKNAIVVLSNSDIYPHGSWAEHLRAMTKQDFYQVSRHEQRADGKIELDYESMCGYCGDVWIFRNPIRLNRFRERAKLTIGNCWSCDNVIPALMIQNKYHVRNPGLTLVAVHLDVVRKPDQRQQMILTDATDMQGMQYRHEGVGIYNPCPYHDQALVNPPSCCMTWPHTHQYIKTFYLGYTREHDTYNETEVVEDRDFYPPDLKTWTLHRTKSKPITVCIPVPN